MRSRSLRGISHVLRDESGATAVFVALLLPVIFGMVVLTVDAGNLWQTRRDVITATDSTALSEARSAFLGESTGANCTTDWDGGSSLLDTNADGTLSDTSCGATRLPNDTGYVTVRTREEAQLFFAPTIGLGDSSQVYSLSAAMFAYPLNFTGAAPITFCDQNGHLQVPENPVYHLANGYWKDVAGNVSLTSVVGGTEIHRFYFGKDDSDDCGESEGNWGWLDFDGGGGGAAEIVDWLLDGYTGSQIDYGDHIGGQPGNPSGSAGTSCPGKVNNISDALDCLIQTGQEIAIIIHDDTQSKNPTKDCNGENCEYQVSSVQGMILHCYYLGGKNTCPSVAGDIGRTGQDAQFFDLEFVDIILSGECCSKAPPDGIDRGVRSIRLCGIDHDRDSSGATGEDQVVQSRCTPN